MRSAPSGATPLAAPFSDEAIRDVLSTALIVMFAPPSNETPLIVRDVLEACYPELPFVWLDTASGDGFVFLLTREMLEEAGY